jgi:hypothetical protein
MKNKNTKISLVLNIIISILVLFSTIAMFTGYRFMNGQEVILESTKLGMLRFFTVQSNLFMGIISLLFIIDEIKILRGNKKEISFFKYVLKLMSTSAVGLTFFVVFAYLGPITKYGLVSLLMNSNLFFHLIIPVLSIITFIFFERTDKIKFKHVLYGIVPTFIYEIYYLTNVLIHTENGMVSPKYDWYWFVQGGIWTALIVVPVIFLISYLISLGLWRVNKLK